MPECKRAFLKYSTKNQVDSLEIKRNNTPPKENIWRNQKYRLGMYSKINSIVEGCRYEINDDEGYSSNKES